MPPWLTLDVRQKKTYMNPSTDDIAFSKAAENDASRRESLTVLLKQRRIFIGIALLQVSLLLLDIVLRFWPGHPIFPTHPMMAFVGAFSAALVFYTDLKIQFLLTLERLNKHEE